MDNLFHAGLPIAAMPGIYCIENTVTGDCYVGRSVNVYRRVRSHLFTVDTRCRGLRAAVDKYGRDAFACFALEYCPAEQTPAAEKRWFDALRPRYNMFEPTAEWTPHSGTMRRRRGFKQSDEFKEKVRRAMTGRRHSNDTIQKLKARRHSQETIEKLRASSTGKTHDAETRAKLSSMMIGNKRGIGSPGMTGKALSPEHKQLLSRRFSGEGNNMFGKPSARRGVPMSEESKARMRKPRSAEARERIAIAQRARRERERLELALGQPVVSS